jgi:hypothetical protein
MYSTCLFCHTQLGVNEAEEIAAISDDMFLPEGVLKRRAEMKGH